MKRLSKEKLNRLFEYYGIVRIGKFAVIKKFSYKETLKDLLQGIANIPIGLIKDIIEIINCLWLLIPRIYIESGEEK